MAPNEVASLPYWAPASGPKGGVSPKSSFTQVRNKRKKERLVLFYTNPLCAGQQRLLGYKWGGRPVRSSPGPQTRKDPNGPRQLPARTIMNNIFCYYLPHMVMKLA